MQRLWRQCAANGDFYQHRYEGLYCNGCEQFYAPGDVAESRCPEHAAPLHRVVEQNRFFRLSTYADELHRVIAEGEVAVVPATKRNEVLAFIKSGLADFSVSRPAGRSGGWGIGVPDDPSQVVYVWWDALTTYVTALGYGTDDGSAYRDWWVDADERVHVIGKGILRFHAVYWLALLLSTKQPLPTSIFVHDYVSVDGEKLAKSAAGAVGPADVVAAYGVDALRWWFVREVPVVGDVDFTVERLVGCANTDLANGLGSLVQRTLTLVRTYSGGPASAARKPGTTCQRLSGGRGFFGVPPGSPGGRTAHGCRDRSPEPDRCRPRAVRPALGLDRTLRRRRCRQQVRRTNPSLGDRPASGISRRWRYERAGCSARDPGPRLSQHRPRADAVPAYRGGRTASPARTRQPRRRPYTRLSAPRCNNRAATGLTVTSLPLTCSSRPDMLTP